MRSTAFGIVFLTTLALLASAAAFTPLASAEKSTNESADEGDNAWVEDCPPDMMCAYKSDENTSSDEGDNAWVEDCPPDRMCAYSDPNQPVDNSTDAGSNCMDGEQEGETCADDRHYMTPPDDGREPDHRATTEADAIRGDAETTSADDEARNNVPAFTMLAAVGLLGSLALALGRTD